MQDTTESLTLKIQSSFTENLSTKKVFSRSIRFLKHIKFCDYEQLFS